jgi:uncharacterized membrane protein HdeD (DUF308 family)
MNDLDLIVPRLASRWWMFALRGVAAIMFGVLVFLGPATSLVALGMLWGLYAIVDGVLAWMLGSASRGGRRFGWFLFEGIVGVAFGLFAFASPTLTALSLVIAISAWALTTGLAGVGASIRLRRHLPDEWLLTTTGVLSIAFGVLVLLVHESAALAPIWMLAVYEVVFGTFLAALGLRLNRWRYSGRESVSTRPQPHMARMMH